MSGGRCSTGTAGGGIGAASGTAGRCAGTDCCTAACCTAWRCWRGLLLLDDLHPERRALLRGAVLHGMGVAEGFGQGPLVTKCLVKRLLYRSENCLRSNPPVTTPAACPCGWVSGLKWYGFLRSSSPDFLRSLLYLG